MEEPGQHHVSRASGHSCAMESGRHDSNHRERSPANVDHFPQDCRILRKSALPEFAADYRDHGFPWPIIVSGESLAQDGPHAKHPEIASGDEVPGNKFGPTANCDTHRTAVPREHPRKRTIAIAKLLEYRIREAAVQTSLARHVV